MKNTLVLTRSVNNYALKKTLVRLFQRLDFMSRYSEVSCLNSTALDTHIGLTVSLGLNSIMNNSPSGHGPWVKYHSRLFEQVGHKTTYTNSLVKATVGSGKNCFMRISFLSNLSGIS